MKIHNQLPLLLDCLERWKKCPSEKTFVDEFALPMKESAGGFFNGFHPVLRDLDWNEYREHVLKLDPVDMEKRLRMQIKAVEDLFGFELQGEVILLGAFNEMDGYARFTQGTHRVFLGVDESHNKGKYLDILMAHELTHVARESRPEVWLGFGLNPKMSNAEFTESQPVIEHLMGEGFSCAVSEILVPGASPWDYVYQTEESLNGIFKNAKALDRIIHAELLDPDGDYGRLYGTRPIFAHYAWAMFWVKRLISNYAKGDPRAIVRVCSKEFISDALHFSLASVSS